MPESPADRSLRTETRLPLNGLTVLDLTLARAGPTCVRHLADWGADVIRIEPPPTGAEDVAGNRHGFDFQNLHRNKRAMHLNLKDPLGHQAFMRLVRTADVIVETMRAQVKHRLKIAYEDVRALNPRIVYASISGFGQDGPYGHRAGVDQIAQGMGGLMSITGLPGQGPVRAGIPIADLTAGLFCALGILTALLEREQSGEGQWVTSSLLQAQIFMLDFQAARWLQAHEVPKQAGNNHPTSIPTGVFKTKDGYINIAAAGQVMWERVCEAIEAPALLDRVEFKTGALRSTNRDALNAEIEKRTVGKTSAEWIAIFNKVGVPCGPI
ncbi:MAG: CaiB/BaiF CoA transferase family protein, partial [Acetobacteraceae bacterium]